MKINWGTVRAPVFGRHQFFDTSEHYRKAHGSLLSGWMNYNYTACCWFPTYSKILILPSQFWQIRFEICWLHCSKCRILVLLRYWISSFFSEETRKFWNSMWQYFLVTSSRKKNVSCYGNIVCFTLLVTKTSLINHVHIYKYLVTLCLPIS